MKSNEFRIMNPKLGQSADAALHEDILDNKEAGLLADRAAVEQAVRLGIPREVAVRLMMSDSPTRMDELSEDPERQLPCD